PIDKQIKTNREGLVRFIRIIDLTTENEPPRYIADPGKGYHVEKNDLFMVRYGAPGLVGYNYEGVIANNLFKIIPKQGVSSSFYYHYFKFIHNYILEASGSSTMPAISFSSISFINIVQPTLEEQNAIANALSDVDALLSELEKLIAKKQAIKTATMQQLLTGRTRLPQFANHPDGSKKGYKQSELGEIPEDWEVIQLGEITTFLKGAGLPKSDLIDSGKNRCIHYGQLFTSYGPKIEKIFSSTDIDGSIKSETNDVLMPTSDVTPNGLATASCILESGIVLGGDILIIRSKKELLDGVFFAYLITVMRDQIMQLVTGSTVYHLYGSDMARFFFARPSIDEQTAIATILADMDEEIQALEHRLNKTRQIKQGMMQELLTGKTRLIKGGKNV
ncbi:MAG TPA: restriction endonuclease subunit S, partial [Pseudomonadales bacterium]|nr:restriction endonuclease subunit S [Pseudomonadales bacterium]